MSASTPPTPQAFLVPGPYYLARDFLGPDDNKLMLDHVLAHEASFRPSRVWTAAGQNEVNSEKRVSSLLVASGEIRDVVQGRVTAALDQIVAALGMKAFEPANYEIEMAAHGDGAFFTPHIDTRTKGLDQPERHHRHISAVYYFHRAPKAFSGGVFRLHALAGTGDPGTYIDIEPANDSMLFFPSWMPHEVLPVSCPSGQFADSRFAINCWIYRS